MSPQRYADHVDAVLTGVDAVLADRAGEVIPDRLYAKARHLYRSSRADYAARWATYARDPDLGHLHARPDLEEVVNNACGDLVTVLGHLLRQTWRRRRPRRPT